MLLLSGPIAVFAIELLRGYGSELYTIQLVNALAAKGISVDLIVQLKDDALVQKIDPRVRLLSLNSRNPLKTIRFLRHYLKQTRPAVLFGVMEKPSLLGIVASALAGYKNIVPTIHFDISAYALGEYSVRRKFLRLLIGFFYRYAKAVVAVSSGVGRALQHTVGPRMRVETILNGFDLALLRERAVEPTSHPWLASKTLPVVVGCGRLVPLKGFDTLIKAFARVRAAKPSRLILFGEGEERPKLQKLIDGLGLQNDAVLAGYMPNPVSCMANGDVFVLPSRTEGFGNVLIEALAAGIKVVSTDCPSGPREILDDGQFGSLVPVDDDKALAEAILETLENPADDKFRAAVQNYLDRRFSIDIMADHYLALAQSIQS